MVIYWLMVMLVLLSPSSFALIIKVTELRRRSQTVVLFHDAHNVASVGQVKHQAGLLKNLLLALDEMGDNRFIYEDLASFSVESNACKVNSFKDDEENMEIKYDMKVDHLNFFSRVKQNDSEKMGYALFYTYDVFLGDQIIPYCDVTTFHFLLDKLSSFQNLQYRSFDPRLAFGGGPSDIFSAPEKMGVIGVGIVSSQHYKVKMSQDDFEAINSLNASLLAPRSLLEEWFSLQHECDELLMDKFNQTALIHTMDLGAVNDIVAHGDGKVVALFAESKHVQFIERVLTSAIPGFELVSQVGVSGNKYESFYGIRATIVDGRFPL